MIKSFIEQHKLSANFLSVAQYWYIPLCHQISRLVSNQQRPLTFGINGCQGSGKSTMVRFIADYLEYKYNYSTVCLSLDDFYFDQRTRLELAESVHRLLQTRGVPGTHDIQRLAKVLIALQESHAVEIPQFNKATDNPFPKLQWTSVSKPVDLILMEGWCWGVEPQTESDLLDPINEIEKQQDKNGIWRSYINQQLADLYSPLYPLMDYWLMLKAPSFDNVQEWRWQQEQKLIEANIGQSNGAVMNKEQVAHFVSYFQRLTQHCLNTMPAACDLVFELDNNRNIVDCIGEISHVD